MNRLLITLGSILLLSLSAQGQSFNSGSTGADGPLDLTSGNRVVQLPESGVLNYTTVNIPANRVLTFKRNSRNTPVYMLAQGNVIVIGTIGVDAGTDPDIPSSNRTPGPGGFYGGAVGSPGGQPGFGPGGGLPDGTNGNGRWVGPLSLLPLIGGSGGATFGNQCAGSGGGGAIVIASSTTINLTGRISASPNAICSTLSQGSGGAIRLVANSLNVSGSLEACGSPHCGVIRLEAPAGSLSFTGTSNPPAGLFPINPNVTQSSSPILTIVSIAGFPVPAGAGQRFDTYDMLLPNQLTDPISVVVQANNIPVGTQVRIGMVNGSPNATSIPAALQGAFASSSATPTISNLTRTAVTYLMASATFDPPQGSAPFNQKGANHIEKVRVESLVGAKPKFVFLRSDGSVVDAEKLLPQFLAQFGQ